MFVSDKDPFYCRVTSGFYCSLIAPWPLVKQSLLPIRMNKLYGNTTAKATYRCKMQQYSLIEFTSSTYTMQ